MQRYDIMNKLEAKYKSEANYKLLKTDFHISTSEEALRELEIKYQDNMFTQQHHEITNEFIDKYKMIRDSNTHWWTYQIDKHKYFEKYEPLTEDILYQLIDALTNEVTNKPNTLFTILSNQSNNASTKSASTTNPIDRISSLIPSNDIWTDDSKSEYLDSYDVKGKWTNIPDNIDENITSNDTIDELFGDNPNLSDKHPGLSNDLTGTKKDQYK